MTSNLTSILEEMGSVLVAYSGGVDSTYLLKAAHDVLGEKALGVVVSAEIHPRSEHEEAEEIASQFNLPFMRIEASVLGINLLCSNPPERCYHCKKYLFTKLKELAAEHGFAWVADGTNASDAGDHRPGIRALAELGIRSPLKEAGMTKDDIRGASKEMGLPTWNKPSMACLASRIPYGRPLDKDTLRKIDMAEEFIRRQGFKQARVRIHDLTARIEVPEGDIKRIAEEGMRKAIAVKLRELGFRYIALDMEGYRTGSLNEAL